MKKILITLFALLLCFTFTGCDQSSNVQKHLESTLTHHYAEGIKYVRVYLFEKEKGYDITVALEPPINESTYQAACQNISSVVEKYFLEKDYTLSKLEITIFDTKDGDSNNAILTWVTSDYQIGRLTHLQNQRVFHDVSVDELNTYFLPDGELHETDLEAESLEMTVMRLISNQVGEGGKIVIVEYRGTELYIKVDISESDPAPLTYAMLAERRAGSITDAILAQEQLDETWEAITLEFVDIGSITLGKADIRSNEFGGRYFDIPIDCFA